MTDPAKEEAICLKAEAAFQIFVRQFNKLALPEAQRAKLEDLIKGSYGPFNVLVDSYNIRIEHYVLPLVRERIKIESELRGEHRVPFSPDRIAYIRDNIHTLVKDSLSWITHAAHADAIRHVSHHNKGSVPEYKAIELDAQRNELRADNPDELFVSIDELLRKAVADSILLAN